VTAEEARGLGLEPPEGAAGRVRLVEADGFDVQPCGGTHPRSTAEVGVVAIVGRERYKGGSRIRFLCGHRVLSAFRQRAQVLDRLGALFSSPLASLAESAERQSAQLAEAERRARDLLDRAIDADARRLLADAGTPRPVVVAVYDAWTPADLKALALRLVVLAPCVALLGSRAEKAHLVFAQSEGLPHDIPALLRDAVESLGGRGGGKGNLAQGGGDRLDGLAAALDRAAARVLGTAEGA
jgi:alanyl-tRNA synthetase